MATFCTNWIFNQTYIAAKTSIYSVANFGRIYVFLALMEMGEDHGTKRGFPFLWYRSFVDMKSFNH